MCVLSRGELSAVSYNIPGSTPISMPTEASCRFTPRDMYMRCVLFLLVVNTLLSTDKTLHHCEIHSSLMIVLYRTAPHIFPSLLSFSFLSTLSSLLSLPLYLLVPLYSFLSPLSPSPSSFSLSFSTVPAL